MKTDPDAIIIENEYCYSYVTFNPQCIIELCVMNKRTDEMAFYLHFQFKTLKHAISLFEEMDQCIKKMVDQRSVDFYYVVVVNDNSLFCKIK